MTNAQPLDLNRFPWSRPLVTACLREYPSVASLFAGDPRDPRAWRKMVANVQGVSRDHEAISRLLAAQLTRRDAPSPARDAALGLADARTVAIVTGQQAGLFGGPLYTILKVITTIQLARRLEREQGVRAVPVFWVDAEDHDWKEVRAAHVLNAEHSLCDITAADLPGAGRLPVHRLTFDAGIAATISDLVANIPPSAFTNGLQERLSRHYHPGIGVGRAFAGLMDDLFGAQGLVIFEAYDPAAKPLVADLFAGELDHPGRTASLVNDAALAMKAIGHAPQIEPAPDSVALFYLSDDGRVPIKYRGEKFLIGDVAHAPAALRQEAAAHPECFSPNVLLRPLVQDRLFPTVCYVAGPSELAYQAQLGGVYEAFGVQAPLLFPRVSATLIDSAAARFLERHHLSPDALSLDEDTALSRLIERGLPTGVEDALRVMQDTVTERGHALKDAIAGLDPTLTGAVDTTLDRMRDTLQSLHSKIVHAAKRNDDTLRRQFKRTYALVYPGGAPQERTLGVAFFLNRYGPELISELLEALPLDTDQHYVLTL